MQAAVVRAEKGGSFFGGFPFLFPAPNVRKLVGET